MKTFTLITALLVAPAAYADTAPTKSDTTATTDKTPSTTDKAAKPGKLSQSELQVLAHYHAVNQTEIDLGKTAKRLGKSDGVKQYGDMLVKEHTAADKQLTAMAKKRGQMIPAEKPMNEAEKQEKADAKTAVAKLKKMKGADFDTAFLAQMVTDHERELAKADAKVAEVQDTELADAIRALKPAFQMHADHARELQRTMNTNASASVTTPSGTTAANTTTATKTTTTSAKR